MTKEDFRALLDEKSNNELVAISLRDDITPFVFATESARWPAFRGEVGAKLGVAATDLRVIGSGRFGFSLKPGNNFKTYTDTSDVDVAIINAALFDELWYGLLAVAYPRPPTLSKIGGWLKERRNEVYTGWLTPLKIKLDLKIYGDAARPLTHLTSNWFRTFQQASRHIPVRHERVNTRLYRTWQHAELYHGHSISMLRQTTTGGPE